ncbi:unnamed protein product [Adineta ricciae]|uniref:Uncharacterized protein n=1 Tax=Adineta ricciae TaxID=249248 RepID=A0A813YK93_ADIRI|nr:unnamed protein product [Adineta ricciae]CAF0936620.1 unnamed protein product [Adineta ricciae]
MDLFENGTSLLNVTTARIRTTTRYVESPLNSWYIGGILFMLSVILVLLYANFYRENAFQILWHRLLTKLHITHRPITFEPSPATDRLSI